MNASPEIISASDATSYQSHLKYKANAMTGLKLSVVIPCYNEEEGMRELHRRVSEVCLASVGNAYELVLVNDGSKDRTWEIMCDLSLADRRVVAVNLSRNHGHQLALSAGLKLCRGQRVFVLDADLQDPPELLPKMMARMDDGCDVVFGQRIKREGETVFKKTSAYFFYRLLDRMVDIDIPTDTGDFRLMSRRAVDVLNSMPEHHRFIRGMVSWIGLRQEAVAYERSARFAGETKYPLSKMIRFAIDAITGFSVRPLRVASYFGICFGVAALLLLAYVFMHYFTGRIVEGWTSLAVIVLTLGSVQLLVAGVMGEYLGRLYVESKGRPLFIIQEIMTSSDVKNESKQPEIG
ncbi:glycosyltransferase family 2 protein [Paracidovorax avenae]|uniref:glycosyltransferase family 2 protein n=1 Tax=Paracidovorax avenae TaxID=80867 RepID=UPI00191024A9|nr:glycosyltransferase family 2 protein [Paracidovorax avenae]